MMMPFRKKTETRLSHECRSINVDMGCTPLSPNLFHGDVSGLLCFSFFSSGLFFVVFSLAALPQLGCSLNQAGEDKDYHCL